MSEFGKVYNETSRLLSPRQNAYLLWASQGRNVPEIAALEGKTESDIERCIAGAIAILGLTSADEAARAVSGKS